VDAPATGRSKTRVPPQPKGPWPNSTRPASRFLRQIFRAAREVNPVRMPVDRGDLPKGQNSSVLCVRGAGHFHTVRFHLRKPHSRAEINGAQFLSERGVIARDSASGRYAIDLDPHAEMPVAALATELLQQESHGSRSSEAWFAKYGSMPARCSRKRSKAGFRCARISIRFQRSRTQAL